MPDEAFRASGDLRTAATISPRDCWRLLHRAASASYRHVDRYAWLFARGKLGRDPAFRAIVERGLLGSGAVRVVDIGCGQALLASLLLAVQRQRRRADRPVDWPPGWPEPPNDACYTGIELLSREIDRGASALGDEMPPPTLICGDMRTTPLPACDVVVVLDVFHYIDSTAQESMLARVRSALVEGATDPATKVASGRLLLRVSDRSSQRKHAFTRWIDRKVAQLKGNGDVPDWGRSVSEWMALLERHGFSVEALPMSQGTPFANVLLVADLTPEGMRR